MIAVLFLVAAQATASPGASEQGDDGALAWTGPATSIGIAAGHIAGMGAAYAVLLGDCRPTCPIQPTPAAVLTSVAVLGGSILIGGGAGGAIGGAVDGDAALGIVGGLAGGLVAEAVTLPSVGAVTVLGNTGAVNRDGFLIVAAAAGIVGVLGGGTAAHFFVYPPLPIGQ